MSVKTKLQLSVPWPCCLNMSWTVVSGSKVNSPIQQYIKSVPKPAHHYWHLLICGPKQKIAVTCHKRHLQQQAVWKVQQLMHWCMQICWCYTDEMNYKVGLACNKFHTLIQGWMLIHTSSWSSATIIHFSHPVSFNWRRKTGYLLSYLQLIETIERDKSSSGVLPHPEVEKKPLISSWCMIWIWM